jgi:hypothetical protein
MDFDRYVTAVWVRYGLIGIVVIVLLAAGLALLFHVDVATWLGLPKG